MIAESFTHPTNLPVQPLGQHNPEAAPPRLLHRAGTGHGI
jgi:hypothetical protein